jgi:hypothetical protein
MIRRRRPAREIAFSFDSFLDVVANVVGIILRLILVAWVGARSYKAFQPPPAPEPAPVLEGPTALPEPADPLTPELARQRAELDRAQALLLEQVRQWEKVRQQKALTAQELAALTARQQGLEAERAALERRAGERGRDVQALSLSLEELQARGRRVSEELEALRKEPAPNQTLRYRTPVSRPLQSEELMFECRQGRVTLIDIGAMMDEVHRVLRDKGEQLKTQWEVRDVTSPVGAFRLRYVIERERGLLDGMAPGAPPDGRSSFRCGVTSWEAEPVLARRGESADEALAAGSAFRRVIDSLDPQQTAVTFWVYTDSFPLYRRLRDYLHERDVVVAGRPLPDGLPVAGGKHGSASRGQ